MSGGVESNQGPFERKRKEVPRDRRDYDLGAGTRRGEDGMGARSRFLRISVLVLGALLVVGGGISGVAPTRAADTGQIYVAQTSRIVRVNDMTGTGWTTLGTPGTGVNQFTTLDGIFVDGAGRIYVADFGNSRIVRVNDMTGAGWTTLDTPGKINFEIFVR